MNPQIDDTEHARRARLTIINGAVESPDPASERNRLEAVYGQVWNAAQLAQDYEVIGFMAPYVVVRRRLDGLKASL